MDALIQLIKENNIRYGEVESVRVEIPVWIAKILRFPDPQNGDDAKFSLHQSLGATLKEDGKIDLPFVYPFMDAGAVDPKYKEARKKVDVVERTDWTGGRAVPWSCPVTVSLKDGRKYTKDIDKIKGGQGNPLSKEELALRHKNLVQGFLSPEQIQRSVDLVFDLENLKDISELTKLATFGKFPPNVPRQEIEPLPTKRQSANRRR